MNAMDSRVARIEPNQFEAEAHYYPRTLNAQKHPLVRFMMSLDNTRIAHRYRHLHPEVRLSAIEDALSYVPQYFRWGGADLFHTTDEQGVRRMVVIETNSCPSGQKSFPFSDGDSDLGGYERLIRTSFVPLLKRRRLPRGQIAVVFDKNPMEASGYAAALADVLGEPVWLAPFYDADPNPVVRFDTHGVMHVCDPHGQWHPIRAAMRYVTQRPWNRIPAVPRTAMLNPVLACLSGGRNKLLAAKAYDFLNADLEEEGLRIRTPETLWDVGRSEVPLWVHRMGGHAVVKVPYSNAGQGVYTITSPAELDAFVESPRSYDRYIVQALVGNVRWSSRSRESTLYHVGTMPDRRQRIYVADLRCMVGASPNGFYPIAMYARRAREPLAEELESGADSWGMLGTNLSVKTSGGWSTEPDRLLLMDNRDFNRLGLGLDDMIEAYIQTVLSMIAVDRMAQRLVTKKGAFRGRLFRSLNPDRAFAQEVGLQTPALASGPSPST